ncbi:MAG: hypothetical protein FWC78_05630 [Defluviitaleaceae bacterium]|nr:hypothetical protein [Defluviitaleaceae bacterium]
MSKFSILTPENAAETKQAINKIQYGNVLNDLKIHQFLKIKTQFVWGRMTTYRLEDFITTDVEIIKHRLEVFEDLLRCDGLIELLRDDMLPEITDISNLSGSAEDGDYYFLTQFHYIMKLRLYVKCVQNLSQKLTKLQFKSSGIRKLAEKIAETHSSQEFTNLIEGLETIDLRIKNVRSMTVGINVDAGMRIDNMGIVSINDKRYTSGGLLDRILRADFNRGDEYTLITPLEPIFSNLSDVQKFELNKVFKGALNTVLKGALKSIPKDTAQYMKDKSGFLTDLIPELCFLVAGHEMLMDFRAQDASICKPTISDNNCTSIENLIHPTLLHKIKKEDLRRNTIRFDDDGMIYVLTGANSGGKSVFLQAVGVAQVLFQLGLHVPASAASMLPVDNIYLHMPTEVTIQNAAGRLENECIALNEMLKTITNSSLVLMDEVFSSTSAYDGSILAEELLKHLAKVSCRGIFSTHIHDLPVQRINKNEKTVAMLDTLVALSSEGRRLYRISRQKPEGHSHAFDIARKYGLLLNFEDMS